MYGHKLHAKAYINSADNQEIRFCVESKDLTGKYYAKAPVS